MVQIISTMAELDAKIEECNRAEAISDDAMRAVFETFRMEAHRDLPFDPLAPEYREAQLRLYREIAGKPYAAANEASVFDLEEAASRPFPFATGSCATAGDYFTMIGSLLQAMALPPKSRIVEFGAGWGLTTLFLAQLGHKVTAVDIEPRFCDLIRRRAAHDRVDVEVVNSDFFWIETAGREFDAAVFFESFHHCDDHLRLLAALQRVLTEEGCIFMAGEPITPDFPVPWGLRLDGNSLWAIRRNGWLELGFRNDYFRVALAHTGWFGRVVGLLGDARHSVWRICRRDAAILRFPAGDSRLRTEVGTRHEGLIELDRVKAGAGLYGPYVDLPPGRYVARIKFCPSMPPKGVATLDVVAENGTRRLAGHRLDTAKVMEAGATAALIFGSDNDMARVEVRLVCARGFSAGIESVEIDPIG